MTFRALSAFGNSFGQTNHPYTQNGILTFLQPTTLPHHFHLLLSKSLSTQSLSFILRSTSSGPSLIISKLHLLCHQLIYLIVPSPFPNTHLAYPPQPDDSADPNFESFARQGVVYQTQTYHHKPPTQQQAHASSATTRLQVRARYLLSKWRSKLKHTRPRYQH